MRRSLLLGATACVLAAVCAPAQTAATPTAAKPLVTATPAKTASAARPAHWGYEGEHGPTKWGTLDLAYAACDKGKAQSPVDITKAGTGTGNPWKLNYESSSLRIAHHEHVTELVDNGHTIQITVEEGSTLTTSRDTYQLKQFHFHTPSEHTVDGKSFAMEVHFVHQSPERNFAVVSLLFAEGATNANLAKLIANFPKAKGESAYLPEVKLDLALHLPTNNASYSYMGSFTTPPCTENVEWLVFRDPVMASREQLDAFAARLKPNNRPVQPLNGRTISAENTVGITQ
jgi:carbonic anhydrase